MVKLLRVCGPPRLAPYQGIECAKVGSEEERVEYETTPAIRDN